MQKQRHIPLFIAAAILLAFTACGSIWDLEIAKTVYSGQTPSENFFGVLFSYIGILPTFVGWSFLGASIFYLSKKQIENTKKRRWLMAFAILLFVLSFFYFCNTLYLSNANAFEVHFLVAYLIGIAVIIAAAHLGYKLSKKSENPTLLNKVLTLAAISLVTLLIISVTKELMCRPRFRFVLAMDNPDYFRSWWQSGASIKASLGANIVTDEFASLPSGHSAYSMFAIFLFPAFADYIGSLKNYKPYLFTFGFVWWALTALSRLTVGAHYLTDVAIAGMVTILAYVIVSVVKRIYIKKKGLKKMQ
jgi:membrane-associated phospholipid phosphatase